MLSPTWLWQKVDHILEVEHNFHRQLTCFEVTVYVTENNHMVVDDLSRMKMVQQSDMKLTCHHTVS